jgi:xanthine dehydrogenase YagS FAD-binding subunit
MQPFALIRPKQLEHAQQLVRAEPETRVLRAGGIDLLDRMKEGLDEPDALVELRGILTAGAGVAENEPLLPADDESLHWPEAARRGHIGALTTLAALAEAELPGADALMQAAGQAATPGIRNTATVGGNLLQRPRCWYFRNRELVCLKKGGDTCLALLGDNRYNAILGGGPSFIVHPSSLATALTALDATVQIHRAPENGDPRANGSGGSGSRSPALPRGH